MWRLFLARLVDDSAGVLVVTIMFVALVTAESQAVRVVLVDLVRAGIQSDDARRLVSDLVSLLFRVAVLSVVAGRVIGAAVLSLSDWLLSRLRRTQPSGGERC
jgi:hypothetical protein